MVVIFGVIIVFFGSWLVGGMLITWPEVPWNVLLIGGLVINGVAPVILYGLSKTIWLGLDMAFNPARADEFRADDPS